ncbi:MAG: adenylate/guanylate cyclase domain-containing protein [Candidatus Cloacimonadaceae bacterium]|jgi:adenylate cyclase|nr:PAS domain-containing protein [Candidatus Cloacimonadota bacterium]MDY0128068.1 adenylate/guanylate cyclase domain-containing protein [Candidatus Cloacimonadaceae bacterium]MCB5255681.1 PAS domain-containing protein [Candidatus Cloacimonadota bacterium]MCK9178502.1 adenylate/guanylate cyclase domain-containing protein [Candidatus Cloacimonadota bacterium]MCK9242596.1 adenylate/guanylate cyclase domain-containing protein [Candidatus Cloacimonadota bacterium]
MQFLEDLKNPDSQLVLTLNSLYDGVYVVDPNRVILFWNKAAELMTGYSAAEVIGYSCKDDILNHIDENGVLLCRSACPIVKAMEGKCNVAAKVYPKSKSGKRFPVETHISLIKDESGELVAALEVFRDISQQEEYRIMQEKFNSLIRKYVSTTTFSDIQTRIQTSDQSNVPRMLDLTVLYLDVVDFTGFSEDKEPEEVVRLLNDLFGICDVITRECYGDIDKFIGDAIMAVFNDANDAVRSAMKILDTGIPELNRVRNEAGLSSTSIRIGINSGLVLQGDVGTIDRKDLTVIGDTVNTAARIEKASIPNRLMISEATLARLSPQLSDSFTFHKDYELRGKAEPIKLFILE